MLKKFLSVLLVVTILFTLSSCGNKTGDTLQTGNQATQSSTQGAQSNTQGAQTEATTQQTPTIDPSKLDQAALTNRLRIFSIENKVAGMTVAVTDGEKIIYNQGFGVDSVDNPDVLASADSVYRIASVSKTFTAIMVLRLYDEGVLDLDTPIKNYVPALKLSSPKAEETMTLRHLLTHTAGMPADDYMTAGSRLDSTMNATILDSVRKFNLSSMPGEGKYQYSTWGYNLIGCVASVVTGKTLSQLIAEYVTQPLGMTATTFDYEVASNSQYPLSLPHVRTSNGHAVDQLLINSAYNAGAGLYSNTADLCKLARFILNGGVTDTGERLLKEETFQQMVTRHQESAKDVAYYGFGVAIRKFGDRYIIGHNGTYYGHNYCCSFYIDEKTGCGVVTLMNSEATSANLRLLVPQTIFGMLTNS